MELKKANGLQHFKDSYEILQGALDSAEGTVQTERRLLEMSLAGQASAALFNGGPSVQFDVTDLAEDFNSSPPIDVEVPFVVPPNSPPDSVYAPPAAALSQGPTDTIYVPPAAGLSQSSTDMVLDGAGLWQLL